MSSIDRIKDMVETILIKNNNYNFNCQKHLYIPLISPGKGSDKLVEVENGNFTTYIFQPDDEGYWNIELPHDINTEHEVSIHLSWVNTLGDDTKSIQWTLDYSSVPHNALESIEAPTHSGTITTSEIFYSNTALVLFHSKMTIPAVQITEEDILGIKITREVTGNDPSNTNGENPRLVGLHMEYISDVMGSSPEPAAFSPS